MTVIKMYDAASAEGVNAIPADAKAVAGYVDGHFVTFPLMVRRFFPRAHCVSIGVFLGHLAEFSDVEPGNPIRTAALVRADFEHRKAHGVFRPGFYADRSDMANIVLPGLSGIPRTEYRLWLANPDRDGVLTAEERRDYEAVQDAFDGLFDVSLVQVERFFPPGARPVKRRHPIKKVIPVVKKVHPSIPVGGIATALAAALSAGGVHLTATEWTALGSVLTALAAATKQAARGKTR